MKTTPKKSSPEPRAAKTKPKVSHYTVTKLGVPCSLVIVLTNQRRGVLVPFDRGTHTFHLRRQARAAINRTLKCARRLRESIIRDWLVAQKEAAAALIAPGELVIVPVLCPPADK
jgi:hypothetical protein